MAEPARPGSWTGSVLVARLLRFGAAGAAITLVLEAREIWQQGYLALGWSYTIGRSLRTAALYGVAFGAVGALALGAIRDNLVASLPQLDDRLSMAGLRGAPARRAGVSIALGALAGVALLGWRWLDEGGLVASVWPWALAAAAATALALAWAGGVAHRRGSAGVWSALFLLGWLAFGSDPYGRSALVSGDGSALAAAVLAAGIVFLIVAAPPPGERGLLRWLALPGLPLVFAAVLVISAPLLRPSFAAGNPQSVVLVAVDTMRLDRTSLSPGDARARSLTPALQALAQRSAVFSEATVPAPWTLPSFASVFTGRYPAEHGATSIERVLRPREQTLAEVLREAGYQTAGVVSHFFLDRRRGMAQGFEHFDERNILGAEDVTGEGVTDAALAWLARRDGRPFFLLAHYFDPHYAYQDHADWDFADPSGASLDLRGLHIYDLRARLATLTPADVRYLRDLYDEEVAYTDRAIGRLLEAVPEDVAVVVVGDHGEEILERGWLGHTISLHREVARVPLVMHLPGVTRPGFRIGAPVETRSVAPTLLDYLQLAGPSFGDAASLLPLLRGADVEERTLFAEVWLPDPSESTGKRVRRTSARRGRWLLLRDHDAGRDRLFAIDVRSGSETPVEAPERQQQLAAELDAWNRRMDAVRAGAPPRELAEDERRRLEALGYL